MTRYEAADGSRVEIPRRTPPTGPETIFAPSDLPWLGEAVERAEADVAGLRIEAERRGIAGLDPRLRAAEAIRQEGRDRFGPDGSGFLDALNGGELWSDFWRAFHCLAGPRAERAVRISGDLQDRALSILELLPRGRRIGILAQAFFPSLRKPRARDGLHALVARELTSPEADLRDWEVGAPTPDAAEGMDDETLAGIARSFAIRSGQLAAFKSHGADSDPAKRPLRLRGGAAPGQKPADRIEALAILEDIPVSETHAGGLVRSEINLNLTQAFHVTMRKARPGIPEGHLMHLALSTRPAGPTWPALNLDDFQKDAAWPYIARHLDIVHRALTGRRLPWEPFFETRKAIDALSLLPKLPASAVAPLAALARSGTKAVRAGAAELLDKG